MDEIKDTLRGMYVLYVNMNVCIYILFFAFNSEVELAYICIYLATNGLVYFAPTVCAGWTRLGWIARVETVGSSTMRV